MVRKRYNDYIPRETAIRVVDSGRTRQQMIEMIEAIPDTSWISIKNKLPEDGAWNIFTDGKNISVERYKKDAIDHFYPKGRWFNFDDVIAWMELPQLYIENEDEKKSYGEKLADEICKMCF